MSAGNGWTRSLLSILTGVLVGCPAGPSLGQTLCPPASAGADNTAPLFQVSGPGGPYPATEQQTEPLPPVNPPSNPGWPATVSEADRPAAKFSYFNFGHNSANWWAPPFCDQCPEQTLQVFVGYDSFRGPADGSWQNNGVHTGLNFGTKLGVISDWTGLGFQVGGSVNVYDWSGTRKAGGLSLQA